MALGTFYNDLNPQSIYGNINNLNLQNSGTGTYTPSGAGTGTYDSALMGQMSTGASKDLANPGLGYDAAYGQMMYGNLQDQLAGQYTGMNKQLQDQYGGWGGRGAGIANAARAQMSNDINKIGASNAQQVYMDQQNRMTQAKQQAWSNAMGLSGLQSGNYNNAQGRALQNETLTANSYNQGQARQQGATQMALNAQLGMLPYAQNPAQTPPVSSDNYLSKSYAQTPADYYAASLQAQQPSQPTVGAQYWVGGVNTPNNLPPPSYQTYYNQAGQPVNTPMADSTGHLYGPALTNEGSYNQPLKNTNPVSNNIPVSSYNPAMGQQQPSGGANNMAALSSGYSGQQSPATGYTTGAGQFQASPPDASYIPYYVDQNAMLGKTSNKAVSYNPAKGEHPASTYQDNMGNTYETGTGKILQSQADRDKLWQQYLLTSGQVTPQVTYTDSMGVVHDAGTGKIIDAALATAAK